MTVLLLHFDQFETPDLIKRQNSLEISKIGEIFAAIIAI